MKAEDRVLLLCARQDFTPGHQEEVQALCRGREMPWSGIAKTAARHGVLPIVGANLRRCELVLPQGFAERLELAILENAAVKERDAARLADGLVRLREVELEAMLLKGTALALCVYDEPWVTTSRDIDLVLRPGPGWKKGENGEKEVRRSLYKSGVECDLREHHDVTMNGVLPVRFERIWAEARPVSFRGADAWVMSPEDLLISLAINACRKRFFRLKGLFDLAESVGRLRDLDWSRLAALAREGHCEGIVYTGLLVTRETLGCALPDDVLEELGVSRTRARLLRSLLTRFVRKAGLAALAADEGARSPNSAMLLSYASFRPAEAWRSFRYSLTHAPVHRPEELATPLATSARS